MNKQKPRRRRVLLVAAFLLLILLVAALVNWRSDASFLGRVKELRAAGNPMSLSDLARPPSPPDQNAVSFLQPIQADAVAMEKELYELLAAEGDWRDDPTDEQLQVIRAAELAHAKVFPALAKAAQCSNFELGHDYTVSCNQFMASMMDRPQHMRTYLRLLDLRSLVLVADGQHDEALQCAVQGLQLARFVDQEPMILNHLIALACRSQAASTANRVLQSAAVSAPMHDELERELAQHDMSGFIWVLKSERAYGVQYLRTMGGTMPLFFLSPLRSEGGPYLDVFDQELAWGAKSWHEIAGETTAHYTGSSTPSLTSQLLPTLQATREAMNRTRAQLRCLRLLNAVQKQHITESPLDFAGLGLPKDATIDPYTGQTLLSKRHPNGWTIYSVGKNQADDGGEVREDLDVGVAPRL